MTVDYEDSDASFQANDCNKIQDIENHGGEIRETNALLTSTCTTATSDHDDEDDKEQILTEVTAHLEHFVASQRRAMSVLKGETVKSRLTLHSFNIFRYFAYIRYMYVIRCCSDALALNMNLLPCTIMNAAMDARLAMNDTHSFGFLPAAQMKGGLL